MVRPCEWYLDEARECRRIRARIHQYFIFGEKQDCTQWLTDYYTCADFHKTRDLKDLPALIHSEEERFKARALASARNNVWTYRTAPPDDWNKPLPDYMQERNKGTVLEFYSKRRQKAKESNSEN